MHGKTDRDRHRGKECQSVLCFVFSVIGVLCRRNLDLCAMYRICVRVLKFCHFENNAWHFGVYSEGSAAIHSHINTHTCTHMMWSDQTDGKMQHKFCAFSKIVRSMFLCRNMRSSIRKVLATCSVTDIGTSTPNHNYKMNLARVTSR